MKTEQEIQREANALSATGGESMDPRVRAYQGLSPHPVVASGGALLGIPILVGIFLMIFPFVAYYASLLQALRYGGWEVGGVLVNSVILDMFLVFSALSGFYFFASRKFGYFFPLGLICLPIGFADSFPRESAFHGSLIWIFLTLFIILVLLSIFRLRTHSGRFYLHIFGLMLCVPVVSALSAFLVGAEAGTYRTYVSGGGYDLRDPDRVTGLSSTTFLEALDYVWPSFAAYLILFSIVRGIFWLVERLRKKL